MAPLMSGHPPKNRFKQSTNCNPIASPTSTTTYTVLGIQGSCIMGPSTMTVNVNPTPPAPTAGSNSPLCSGATLNLTATAITGATYHWTGTKRLHINLSNQTLANVNPHQPELILYTHNHWHMFSWVATSTL